MPVAYTHLEDGKEAEKDDEKEDGKDSEKDDEKDDGKDLEKDDEKENGKDPEEEEIKMYHAEYEDPDGQNGYYISAPVSYTHLDVYKRQQQQSMKTRLQ